MHYTSVGEHFERIVLSKITIDAARIGRSRRKTSYRANNFPFVTFYDGEYHAENDSEQKHQKIGKLLLVSKKNCKLKKIIASKNRKSARYDCALGCGGLRIYRNCFSMSFAIKSRLVSICESSTEKILIFDGLK